MAALRSGLYEFISGLCKFVDSSDLKNELPLESRPLGWRSTFTELTALSESKPKEMEPQLHAVAVGERSGSELSIASL